VLELDQQLASGKGHGWMRRIEKTTASDLREQLRPFFLKKKIQVQAALIISRFTSYI
jgi:hypothetical protein